MVTGDRWADPQPDEEGQAVQQVRTPPELRRFGDASAGAGASSEPFSDDRVSEPAGAPGAVEQLPPGDHLPGIRRWPDLEPRLSVRSAAARASVTRAHATACATKGLTSKERLGLCDLVVLKATHTTKGLLFENEQAPRSQEADWPRPRDRSLAALLHDQRRFNRINPGLLVAVTAEAAFAFNDAGQMISALHDPRQLAGRAYVVLPVGGWLDKLALADEEERDMT